MARSTSMDPIATPALTSTPLAGLPADVLVLATSTRPWNRAVTLGVDLAARWGSHLTGCFADATIRGLGGADTEPAVIDRLMQPANLEASRAEAAEFAALAHRRGVRDASWTTAHTGMAATLRQLGAWHDIAIMERDVVDESNLLELFGETMLTCRMPCLILPPNWTGDAAFGHIAIGWNGSIEAVRAIHAALPLLLAAKQVTLMDGSLPPSDDVDRTLPQFDPARYLSSHGVHCHRVGLHVAPAEAGEALLKEVQRRHADLLVMGGYSHSRLRARVLGGATRHVLGHAQLALLMQH